jgi:hypothetical protein
MVHDLKKLPPLTLWRLVLGLILIPLGLLGLWVELHKSFDRGWLVFLFSFYGVISLTGILNWQPKGDIKPIHSVLMITGFIAFLALLWFNEKLPAWAKDALLHPAAFATGWVILSGLLISHWWKRRNNTPYLSEDWKQVYRE